MKVKFKHQILQIKLSLIKNKLRPNKLHNQEMEPEMMAAEPDRYINKGTSIPILPLPCLEFLKVKVEKAQEFKEKMQRSLETFSTQDKILKPNSVKSLRLRNEKGSSDNQLKLNFTIKESPLQKVILATRVMTKYCVQFVRWASKTMRN